MANINSLRERIVSTIYPNGNKMITAAEHQALLLDVANVIGEHEDALAGLKDTSADVAYLEKSKISKTADDYYPQLSVGTADNLAGVDVVAGEFTFRQSGGGAIADGVARLQTIKGNSVVWNQKVEKVYVSGDRVINLPAGETMVKGNKYIALRTKANGGMYVFPVNDMYDYYLRENEYYKIFTNTYTPTNLHIYCTAESGYIALIDLTKMFGAGNEPNTIAEFYARIPSGVDIYGYNSGYIVNLYAEGIKSKGVNAWDEQWENGGINNTGALIDAAANFRSADYIDVLPHTTYYFKKPQGVVTYLLFYDNNYNFVQWLDPFATVGEGGTFVTPNAAFMKFTCLANSYNYDICINISNADTNGKYYPYNEAFQDLSLIRKYFPAGMRSAGNTRDEIRYNAAAKRWEAIKRVEERAYSVGDNLEARLTTNGVVTNYPLAEPVITTIEETSFNLDFPVWDGGTEQVISEEATSALYADIAYGFNAVGLIKQLRAELAALRASL